MDLRNMFAYIYVYVQIYKVCICVYGGVLGLTRPTMGIHPFIHYEATLLIPESPKHPTIYGDINEGSTPRVLNPKPRGQAASSGPNSEPEVAESSWRAGGLPTPSIRFI